MRHFADTPYALSPEIRRLTSIVESDSFQKLEAETREREQAEADERRSNAAADMVAADEWFLAEEPAVAMELNAANSQLEEAHRALHEAKQVHRRACGNLYRLRQECERRKMVARRVLHATVPSTHPVRRCGLPLTRICCTTVASLAWLCPPKCC